VSYAQLVNADTELWRQVAALRRDGCKQITPDGRTAFEKAWADSQSDLRLRLFLAPLPRGGSASSSSSSPGGAPIFSSSRAQSSIENKLLGKLDQLKNDMANLKRKQENLGGPPRGNKKGKGKGKGGKRNAPRMPDELAGMADRTANNEPICFAFNTARGCTACPPGQRCSKGKHVCCKPGCGGNHPLSQCTLR